MTENKIVGWLDDSLYCDNSSAQAGTEAIVADEDFSTLDSEDNDTNIYANGTAASPKLGP
jgi:hypothetical protein